MMDSATYLFGLLVQKKLLNPEKQRRLFELFSSDETHLKAAEDILFLQNSLMEKWKWAERAEAIVRQAVTIPNARVGQPYEARLDRQALGWQDMTRFDLKNLEDSGLTFDPATGLISGTPLQAGDLRMVLVFSLQGEPEEAIHEKQIPLIVIADPKTLWKELPTDPAAPFQKENESAVATPLGERFLIAASKRGRSHANNGSFREDDFAFAQLENSGWSIVAVADGAGSASLSREGSRLACEAVVNHFREMDAKDLLPDALFDLPAGEEASFSPEAAGLAEEWLSGAALAALHAIERTALRENEALRIFHTTLVFVLFKPCAAGHVLLSFSVGDCPAAVLVKDNSGVTLLNRLDVGEFGGGTRFLTSPEVSATPGQLRSRCRIQLIAHFSMLVLMTDGIYDAKFEVEAHLEQAARWQQLLEDLRGNNGEQAVVDLSAGNLEGGDQLLKWMAFWSPGNHDDRTLLLVF